MQHIHQPQSYDMHIIHSHLELHAQQQRQHDDFFSLKMDDIPATTWNRLLHDELYEWDEQRTMRNSEIVGTHVRSEPCTLHAFDNPWLLLFPLGAPQLTLLGWGSCPHGIPSPSLTTSSKPTLKVSYSSFWKQLPSSCRNWWCLLSALVFWAWVILVADGAMQLVPLPLRICLCLF